MSIRETLKDNSAKWLNQQIENVIIALIVKNKISDLDDDTVKDLRNSWHKTLTDWQRGKNLDEMPLMFKEIMQAFVLSIAPQLLVAMNWKYDQIKHILNAYEKDYNCTSEEAELKLSENYPHLMCVDGMDEDLCKE